MVGGPTKGTRFRPLSLNTLKPLIPLAGMPMVHHPLSACQRIPNLAQIYLIGFYEDHEFAMYVSSISHELRVPVRYLKEEKPHGSAGGLYSFRDYIMEDNPGKYQISQFFYVSINLSYVRNTWAIDVADALILIRLLAHLFNKGIACLAMGRKLQVESTLAMQNLQPKIKAIQERYKGNQVAITPEVTSRAVCRKIISELVNIYKDSHLGCLTPAYDGRKSLYTAGALPFTSQQFKIKLAEKERGDKEFGVTIKYAGQADLHHLQQFLHGRQFDAPQETIQVLDIVLREYPSQNYVTVARSFCSKKLGATKDIGDGLECWRGYYQSLRPTQMGLSLNIDIVATSFYKSIPVIAFAKEYLNIRDTPRTLIEKQRIALKKALRGIRVEVTHRKDCRRRYKINGLTNEPLGQLMFPVDDKGNKMRMVQYFQEKYRCKIDYLTWPCLQSGSDSRPTYLPMETCKIVEGQRFLKKLNEKQVTEILRATCQRPDKREKSIWEMVMENKYEDDKYAREFGIKVAKQLTFVEARVLPPPMRSFTH